MSSLWWPCLQTVAVRLEDEIAWRAVLLGRPMSWQATTSRPESAQQQATRASVSRAPRSRLSQILTCPGNTWLLKSTPRGSNSSCVHTYNFARVPMVVTAYADRRVKQNTSACRVQVHHHFTCCHRGPSHTHSFGQRVLESNSIQHNEMQLARPRYRSEECAGEVRTAPVTGAVSRAGDRPQVWWQASTTAAS